MPPCSGLPIPSAPALPASLLGGAPLIPGDNTSNYESLLALISGTVRPSNVLEEI
jgi:hypothetical protein